jgi:hypothetical protein
MGISVIRARDGHREGELNWNSLITVGAYSPRIYCSILLKPETSPPGNRGEVGSVYQPNCATSQLPTEKNESAHM